MTGYNATAERLWPIHRTVPILNPVISIYLDPLRSTWLASDLQQTSTWSKLSPQVTDTWHRFVLRRNTNFGATGCPVCSILFSVTHFVPLYSQISVFSETLCVIPLVFDNHNQFPFPVCSGHTRCLLLQIATSWRHGYAECMGVTWQSINISLHFTPHELCSVGVSWVSFSSDILFLLFSWFSLSSVTLNVYLF